MKKYYAAYFPDIEDDHWISVFRSQHDEKSRFVAPHVTLFFPVELDSAEALRREFEQLVLNFKKFNVRFRSAMMMPEKIQDGFSSSIFLVPDEGFGEILRLHDLLYARKFAHLLRLDIPFVPHITIGSNLSLATAKKLVDELNARKIDLEFILDRVTIVEIDEPMKDRILTAHVELKSDAG